MQKNRYRRIWKKRLSALPVILFCMAAVICSLFLAPGMSAGAKYIVDVESPDGPLGYGVYIGATAEQLHAKLDNDKGIGLAIIDAQYVSSEDMISLKSGGRRVYSYLNIGSIEEFRDYYSSFSDITLAPYENWPGEYWIDVSEEKWQDYVCDNIAAELVLKGVDGFFIDNCDVYYMYNHSWIYKGIVKILTRLKNSYNLPIIINGGNDFVTALLDSGNQNLIDGVNQESVYSTIEDYDKKVFGERKALDRAFYEEYLARAKKEGLIVYMIEYTRDMRLVEKIKEFCQQNGYKCYVTDSLALDGNVKL